MVITFLSSRAVRLLTSNDVDVQILLVDVLPGSNQMFEPGIIYSYGKSNSMMTHLLITILPDIYAFKYTGIFTMLVLVFDRRLHTSI